MQQMVDQLQCDSCLESSDAQNAQQVSLPTPPKLWQAVKIDTFELEDSQRKGFFALYMDAACKLSSCSCFLEGNPRQRFEPNGATLISHLAKDWMQHFPQFQFLISDPGGCFVSDELREWASIRGIVLLTAKSGLWLGPARVIMTGAIQQWSGSVHSTTGQIGVVSRKQAD